MILVWVVAGIVTEAFLLLEVAVAVALAAIRLGEESWFSLVAVQE